MIDLPKREVRDFCLKMLEMHYSSCVDLSKSIKGVEEEEVVKALMNVCFCYHEIADNAVDMNRMLPFLESGLDKKRDLEVVRKVYDFFR